MSRFVSWDSEEGRKFRLSQRILVSKGPRGAVAVHVTYENQSFLVDAGNLSRSIKHAKEHLLEYMLHNPPRGSSNAVIAPVTQEKALALTGIDLKADVALIVATCFDTIRDCPDANVRLEAARLLAQVSQFTGDRECH